MPYKKKVSPGSIQFNKLIAELPEERKNKSTGSIQTWSYRESETS